MCLFITDGRLSRKMEEQRMDTISEHCFASSLDSIGVMTLSRSIFERFTFIESSWRGFFRVSFQPPKLYKSFVLQQSGIGASSSLFCLKRIPHLVQHALGNNKSLISRSKRSDNDEGFPCCLSSAVFAALCSSCSS